MNVTEAKPNGITGRCLPALLTEQGYATAFFQSATEHYDSRRELVHNFGYGDFFPVDVMDKDGYVRANYFGWEDDIMLGPSRAWLTKHRDQPFLTGYLTVTSHHDYRVPTTIDTEHLSDDPGAERLPQHRPLRRPLRAATDPAVQGPRTVRQHRLRDHGRPR